jgi:hypothetical protein
MVVEIVEILGAPKVVSSQRMFRASAGVTACLPDTVQFWPKTATQPHFVIAFDVATDKTSELKRVAIGALRGFHKRGHRLAKDDYRGEQDETLIVVTGTDHTILIATRDPLTREAVTRTFTAEESFAPERTFGQPHWRATFGSPRRGFDLFWEEHQIVGTAILPGEYVRLAAEIAVGDVIQISPVHRYPECERSVLGVAHRSCGDIELTIQTSVPGESVLFYYDPEYPIAVVAADT